MKQGEKKQGRINSLYDRALKGKYTNNGKFSFTHLVADAKSIGVASSTAKEYANQVVELLQDRGHLK